MAALQFAPGTDFDAGAFDDFLGAQPDLGAKWSPTYVRITELPVTATAKIVKRELRAERWECADPVWWRPARGSPLQPLTGDDVAAIRAAFVANGRERALETS
jgi:fatty-acyl-CoA synthase